MPLFRLVPIAIMAALMCMAGCVGPKTESSGAIPPFDLARDGLIRVAAGPGGRVFPVWWMPRASAKGVLVLLPGAEGDLRYDPAANMPKSRNFLVRSRELFRSAGFNVAIVGKPEGVADMTMAYRATSKHGADLSQVLAAGKQWSDTPLWLIGTSRGTISATVAALAAADQVDGMALISSIVNPARTGNIPSLPLASITVPVLVLHHTLDQCRHCPPERTPDILAGLVNAPVKKLLFVSGGSGARGNPCEALHYHGLIGMEEDAVADIVQWITHPES